jgi:HJR/Mrr/RecB family endonuclease
MTEKDFAYIAILIVFLVVILILMYFLLIKKATYSDSEIDYNIDDGVYLQLENGASLEELFDSLNARDFEVFVADLYNSLGYDVSITRQTRDGGRDIEMEHGFKRYFVECKRYRDNRKVNIGDVQKFSSVINDARVYGKIVTTGKFTKPAILYAKSKNIELITKEKIILLVMGKQEN